MKNIIITQFVLHGQSNGFFLKQDSLHLCMIQREKIVTTDLFYNLILCQHLFSDVPAQLVVFLFSWGSLLSPRLTELLVPGHRVRLAYVSCVWMLRGSQNNCIFKHRKMIKLPKCLKTITYNVWSSKMRIW